MGNRPPIEGELTIVVTVFMPVPKSWSSRKQAQALAGLIRPTTKPDWDNLGKTAADALNEVVYLDDKQVVDGSVHKFYSDRPRLVVTIAPYHKAHGNVSTSDVLV
jgi:Holliday junction resolvase RusA-like endonuclease